MDSVEVIENGKAIFAAPVATPEYTPPEHYIGDRIVIEETWDRFSLGIIFYQLLLGLHPFAAMSHPPYDNLVSLHDKIQHDLYVHDPAKKEFFKVIPPPHKRHDELPLKIQQLFLDCFTTGAKNPFSRPSALEWCNALAILLNLPFKGVLDYDLPYKSLPQINFQPSDLYFTPQAFITNIEISSQYIPLDIERISLKDIQTSSIPTIEIETEKINPSILFQAEQEKLWNDIKSNYKKHLKKHRNNLFFVASILISIFFLGIFLTPWFFLFGLILPFTSFSALLFQSSKDIIHSIGEIILPTSTYDILFKQDDLSVSCKQQNSDIQTLETKKEALKQDLNQLLEKTKKAVQEHLRQVAITEKQLIVIQEKRTSQKVLIDSILPFNSWVEQELNLQLKETRAKELNAYKTLYKQHSKQFHRQLLEKKEGLKNTFRDFNNKIFKLEKGINIQKKQLQKIKNSNIKEQLLIDYKAALEANKLHYATELNAYEKNNKKPLPIEIQSSKPLRQLKQKLEVQLKYTKRRQQEALKKAKNKLGKNFQVNLKKYLALLYKSGETTQLHFAHNRIREQFNLFRIEISKLNFEEELQLELTDLFTAKAHKNWTIIPQVQDFNLTQLDSQRVGMLTEWNCIENELQQLQEKITLLQSKPLSIDDNVFMTSWLEQIRTSVLSLKANENTYHGFQKSFYNDSQIARIHKALKSYYKTKEVQQNLKDNYSKQVLVLNQEKNFSEERIRLNKALVLYRENSILEEKEQAEKITSDYEQTLINLNIQWNLETEKTKKQLTKDTEELTQVNIDFQLFQDNIKTTALKAELTYPEALEKTRLKFEAVYKNYESTYTEKLTPLKTNVNRFLENNLILDFEIEQHRKKHLENINYIFTFRNNLERLQEIEQEILSLDIQRDTLKEKVAQTTKEKIKVDTLVKWQENYSTKIYIKDLLLNKVEQFKEDQNKSN
jgi:hypothetical protein